MGTPVHRNYNKYVWIGIARMKMASNLKTSGRIFQVTALVPQRKSVKLILACFCFENFIYYFPLGGIRAIHV